MSWKFEKSDFFQVVGTHIHPLDAANKANAKLKQWLEAAPVIYGHNNGHWSPTEDWIDHHRGPSTHTARLICIEPIKMDTVEDLLRELFEDSASDYLNHALLRRARKLLEEK